MIRTPARDILAAASEENDRVGHENLGFLSASHGFIPRMPPAHALPELFRPWDDAAHQLPELWRTRHVRKTIAQLPLLDADQLPDASLLRAATVLGILAHAYHHCEEAEARNGVLSITKPWEVVNRRLGRAQPMLSYIDLVVYNWKCEGPTAAAADIKAEELQLLVPTVDNQEERLFYLVQFEMLARSAALVGSVVRAQESALRADDEGLARELSFIADRLGDIAHQSLAKIDPNEESSTHVNPIVWATTVATLGGPTYPGEIGASGAAWPTAHMLDAFFGRRAFKTLLGETAKLQHAWYPRHWKNFIRAVADVSVHEHIARMQNRALHGLYQNALHAYAGDSGLLARHRLKVYGFLEPTFRLGRAGTTGGAVGHGAPVAKGSDKADQELASSRAERYDEGEEAGCHFARVIDTGPPPSSEIRRALPITFDISGLGIRYRAGDRCQVLPEHSDDLVEKTLRALRATGAEAIALNQQWRTAVAFREGYTIATSLPLRTLLRFGHIRPVERSTAKLLHSLTGNERLHRIIEARAEDQFELWEMVEMLAESGFNPRMLWRMHAGERESICRVVPPESFRTYSIASIATDHVRLTVGPLHYRSGFKDRKGTASNFLATARNRIVPIRVVRPPRFSLPADPAIPIVMFAGGTGLAPFRGFILQREQQQALANAHLFLSVRGIEELCDGDDITRAAAAGMHLHVVSTRIENRRIDDEMRRQAEVLTHRIAEGAHLYVCGSAGFSKTVIDALGRSTVRRLTAEGRLHQEVFTTYAGVQSEHPNRINASAIALHNDEVQGYWMVISGRVYDVTEFAHLHPGGGAILRGYAGTDATAAYRRVLHHVNPEVDAMLAMYDIGVVRRLDFGAEWGVAIGSKGLRVVTLADTYKMWVRLLYTVTERENTLRWGTPAPWSVDAELREIWAVTAGLCSTDEDLRWMSVANPDAGALKHALIEGVAVFEEFERESLRGGAGKLLAAARNIRAMFMA